MILSIVSKIKPAFTSLILVAMMGYVQTSQAMKSNTVWSMNDIPEYQPATLSPVLALSLLDLGIWGLSLGYLGPNTLGGDLSEWMEKGSLSFFLELIQRNPNQSVIPFKVILSTVFIINDLKVARELLSSSELINTDIFNGKSFFGEAFLGELISEKREPESVRTTQDEISNLSREIIKACCGKRVDLCQALSDIALVTFCKISFDVDIREFLLKNPLGSCFDECLAFEAEPLSCFWSDSYNNFAKSKDKAYEWGRELIKLIREKSSYNSELVSNELLESLIKGIEITDEQIKSVLLSLIAARESTSLLLTATLYTLLTTTEGKSAIERIRVEHVASSDYEKKVSRSYLDLVVDECLRLFPPVWAIPLRANKELLCGGLKIPKGSAVILPILVMQRDKNYFGDHPEAFNPERMKDERKRKLNSAFAERTDLANIVRTLLEMIITEFNIEILGEHKPKPCTKFTFRLIENINVIIKEINNALSSDEIREENRISYIAGLLREDKRNVKNLNLMRQAIGNYITKGHTADLRKFFDAIRSIIDLREVLNQIVNVSPFLHRALRNPDGASLETIKLLLENGADPNIQHTKEFSQRNCGKVSRGDTAADIAATHNQPKSIMLLLEEFGAKFANQIHEVERTKYYTIPNKSEGKWR